MSDDAALGLGASPQARWRAGRVALGALLGALGHVLALVGGLIAGRTAVTTAEFDDLTAVAVTFFGVQLVTVVVVLVAGAMLLARRRVDVGTGLFAGWLAGAIFCTLVISGLIPVS